MTKLNKSEGKQAAILKENPRISITLKKNKTLKLLKLVEKKRKSNQIKLRKNINIAEKEGIFIIITKK